MLQPQGWPWQLWSLYWWFFSKFLGWYPLYYVEGTFLCSKIQKIRLLIVCYNLKGSLGSSGGFTDDVFFRKFWAEITSLCLSNLPVLKNSKNIKHLLILCYSLKGGLGSSGGCSWLRNLPVLENSKNVNCLLIACYRLKGSLSSFRGCTDEFFPTFLCWNSLVYV